MSKQHLKAPGRSFKPPADGATPRRARAHGRSISQPGLLAALCGLLLLGAYIGLPVVREALRGTGFLLPGVGILALLWGSVRVIAAWFWPAGKASADSARVQISWQGIFLILAGGVAFDAADSVPDGIPSAALSILAVVLIGWGLREIVLRLVPAWRSRRARRRQMLTQPGLVYLGIMISLFLGSLLGHSNPLMLVFSMLIGAFVLNGWITYSMLKRLRVQRELPERTMAGEAVSVEVTLENRKRLLSCWLMVVTDRVQSESERLEPEVVLARVAPRGATAASYLLRPMRRGRYAFGPLDVSTRFPLGLVERGLTMPARGELLVYPRLGRLLPAWRREREAAEQFVHLQEARRGSYHDDFHGLREFRWGDNPRAIHWRTSARRSELMVCEYDESRDRNFILLVDLWQPDRATDADRDRVELAVSFAATVCVAQLRQSRDAELALLVAGESFTEWRGSTGAAALESMLDLLAVVRSGPAPNLVRLLQTAAAHRAPGTQTVLVTTRSRTENGLAEWERLVAQRWGADRGGELKVVEAEAQELSRYFQLETSSR